MTLPGPNLHSTWCHRQRAATAMCTRVVGRLTFHGCGVGKGWAIINLILLLLELLLYFNAIEARVYRIILLCNQDKPSLIPTPH